MVDMCVHMVSLCFLSFPFSQLFPSTMNDGNDTHSRRYILRAHIYIYIYIYIYFFFFFFLRGALDITSAWDEWSYLYILS